MTQKPVSSPSYDPCGICACFLSRAHTLYHMYARMHTHHMVKVWSRPLLTQHCAWSWLLDCSGGSLTSQTMWDPPSVCQTMWDPPSVSPGWHQASQLFPCQV